jgi:serine O-acetyltransferase
MDWRQVTKGCSRAKPLLLRNGAVLETQNVNRRLLLDADWLRLCKMTGAAPVPRSWKTNFSPRFTCVVLVRTAQYLYARGWRRCSKLTSLLSFLIFGIEVPPSLVIGPGLILPHPQGVILGAARIGSNVTIYQQVTLGAKVADWSYDLSLRPVVEDGVTITAGARVIGPIRLGQRCLVGANAVVVEDVPDDAVVGGIPARILKQEREA